MYIKNVCSLEKFTWFPLMYFSADIWRTRCNSVSDADKDCIFISFQTDIKLPSWRIGELWQQFLTKQGQWLDEGYWTIICQQYFYLLYKAREGCISTTIRSGRSSRKNTKFGKMLVGSDKSWKSKESLTQSLEGVPESQSRSIKDDSVICLA